MRIISGEWRGRRLFAPEGDVTRPTADRTREALFSMLLSRLGSFEGLYVADLFAGSGALGLEALSRGAARCLFVEQDPAAIRTLRRNIANLGAQARCDVRAGSVLTLPKNAADKAGQPDLVLMDPPYETGAGAVALDRMNRLGWIAPGAWISIETSRKEDVSVAGFEIETVRDNARARLHLLRPVARKADG